MKKESEKRNTIIGSISFDIENFNWLESLGNKSKIVNDALRFFRKATITKEGKIKMLRTQAKELMAEAHRIKQQAEDLEE